ncbi:hypothetical protein GCM10012284_44220 [Mangrovihabitans endophyticus]|uniref:O-antigen ligase-related domain-containing protein n=2 Tax=Mangrovihabitans endophyticus TaxID=1751298 RepID=A0A8J3C2A1_9ACTN|nr:hypothetical protein GCM10012284_44220 [Mangrovihabitans endophyticus]
MFSRGETPTAGETPSAGETPGAGGAVGVSLPVAVLMAAVAAGIVAQGGYYPPGRMLVTALTFVAAIAAWFSTGRRSTASRSTASRSTASRSTGRRITASRSTASRSVTAPAASLALPTAAGALALWALIRGFAAASPALAVAAAATLACMVAGVALLRRTSPAERVTVTDTMIAIGALVAATAWIGVAWRVPRLAVLVEGRLWRGASTLTYPNAAAALLAATALLAIALTVTSPRSPVRLAASYLILVGVGAALSRAGILALVAGLLLIAARSGVRATTRAGLPPLAGAGVAVAALVPSMPVGSPPHPLLSLAGLIVGLVIAVGVPRLPSRAGLAVLLGLVAAGGLAVAVVGNADAVHRVLDSRGTVASSGRSFGARAALDVIAGHPVAGTGIGRAFLLWREPGGNARVAHLVHNEYLQVVVDLGLIGAVLLAGLLAAIVLVIRRGRACGAPAQVRTGAIAALVALAVHSGFDFLWHLAVIPLVAGLLVGLTAAATGDKETTLPRKGHR